MAPLSAEHKAKMAAGRAKAREARFTASSAGIEDTQAPPTAAPPTSDGKVWISPSGETIHLSEVPPWAHARTSGKGRDASDARQFVQVPDNWRLRWRNPKSLDVVGQLGWMPVTTSTPGVKVIVRSMVAPDNTIRRGYNGDILHFMPEEWWQNRVADKQAIVERISGSARERQHEFIEDANRGKFGRYIRGQDPKIPVATGFDARSGDHPT